MDAKMLSQLIEGYERCTPPFLPPVVLVALKEYRDLLAAMEGSTDEIVRELLRIAKANRRYGEAQYAGTMEQTAAALMAMKAAKEKAEAERDSLKQHAEAMEETNYLKDLLSF